MSQVTPAQRPRPTTRPTHMSTTTGDTTMTTHTDLGALATGAFIRIDDETVALQRVERIAAPRAATAALAGIPLTRITFERDGDREQRVYPTQMVVEQVACR